MLMSTTVSAVDPVSDQAVEMPSPGARTLRCGGRLLSLERPLVMAIVNITDNSFYAGSRTSTQRAIARRVQQLVEEGADIVDVGACSTRPGSTPVTEVQEMRQLAKALTVVRKLAPQLPISIDTYRASVAEAMIYDFGVEMVNDISAGDMDPQMHELIAEQNVAYVMMHMQGTPAVMQQNPTYDDVVGDILRYFTQKVRALREMGVTDLIIDPGFGFGKTLEHNYALLRNLPVFQVLDLPILVGVSRKSMLTKPLGIDATQALAATQAVDTIALLNGASILRVHDVRPAVEAVKLCALYQAQPAW